MEDEAENELVNSMNKKWGPSKPISGEELARLIEATYQYIYTVEEMRISRRIGTIEDLFAKNPLNFEAEKVNSQLQKLKKLEQNADLLKSHLELYDEQVAE